MDRIRVVLGDQEPVRRRGLRATLEETGDLEVLGDAPDGPSTLAMVEQFGPDLLLMVRDLPPSGGLSIAAFVDQMPGRTVRTVVLGEEETELDLVEAARAGVGGFLPLTVSEALLVDTLRVVAAGGAVMLPSARGRLLRHVALFGLGVAVPVVNSLTNRERDILRLLGEGCSNSEIAERLAVSEETVKSHVSRLLTKLGVRSRLQAGVLFCRLLLAGDLSMTEEAGKKESLVLASSLPTSAPMAAAW